jgi:LysR family transcriptional regulator, low CO2-responsive transcriptional regulator
VRLLEYHSPARTKQSSVSRRDVEIECFYQTDKRPLFFAKLAFCKGTVRRTPLTSEDFLAYLGRGSAGQRGADGVESWPASATMDFDQLETFLEVARLSSFSRAAEKRFRTQPAISSQIRGLEEEVGAKLLDRSGGKVSLTASGKIFQKYAEETLEARRAILTAIAETERVPRGEIIVGANEGTCLHILPEVFAEFKKLYPDVAININRADYAKILESVIDNSVDFGVVSLPVTDGRLTVVPIHRDELIVIVPPRHPLAKSKSVGIADAAQYPLVMPKAGHTRDALDNLFHENRLKPRYAMELDSSELLKRFVAADMGVGFISRSNVIEDVRAEVLTAIPLADAQIRRDLALVFRKDKALSRAALAFIDTAVKIKTPEAALPARG